MDNQNKVIRLGYLDNCGKKTVKPLTGEMLEKLITSDGVKNVMAQMESTSDENLRIELKKQLPCVLYQCQLPGDGVRPTVKSAVASGFCMHDWDHMVEQPREFYWQNISGREDEVGIVLAHITPRGHGLRLVTRMKRDESIAQCQERVAALFKMEQYADRKITDLTRLSFLPCKDYMLYVNKVGLFEASPLALPTGDGAACVEVGNCDVKIEGTQSEPKRSGASSCVSGALPPGESLERGFKIAESFTYNGIKYSAIIESLLQRIATQGVPREGERNNDLYTLVRELRHICEYSFDKVYMLVAPYFDTLPDQEIRRTIASSIASNGRTITPLMRGVLSELQNENVAVPDGADVMKEGKLPKVSAVEEMILSKYPKYLRNNVFMAMLPIWGTYGTHVRFDFLSGRENSLSFMTAVVGKSGSGKAFAADLFDKMTGKFNAMDMVERQKANDYLDEFTKAGEGDSKPNDPRPRVRLYGDDITTSQLLEYLDNLNGEHGLQFTEEVIRLQKAKRSVWGDNDDLYCKAFDNAIGGKESKSKQTRNIRIPIYLNTLFCGTTGAMHKFYSNPEGGLNNRMIFVFMPNVRIKGFPKYGKFSEADQKLFDEAIDRLWEAGQDGKKLELPWLEKVISSLKNKWDKDEMENPDEVWYDAGKRALIVGMRVGVMQWILRGCPDDDKSHRAIGSVVRWMADTMRMNVYRFSGKEYEKIADQENAAERQVVTRMSKNKKLFSLLDDEFSIQDVIALRVKNGDSANVYMVLSRWLSDGLITSDGRGHYSKVKVLVA